MFAKRKYNEVLAGKIFDVVFTIYGSIRTNKLKDFFTCNLPDVSMTITAPHM